MWCYLQILKTVLAKFSLYVLELNVQLGSLRAILSAWASSDLNLWSLGLLADILYGSSKAWTYWVLELLSLSSFGVGSSLVN